jgi:hypothetical protein
VDPRLKGEGHTFSAAQGGSSYNVVQFNCATPQTNQVVFSVPPPSPQVVVQRAVNMDFVVNFALNVQTIAPGQNTVGSPAFVWGRDFAVARAAPLGQLVSAFNVQVNNAAVQQQSVPLPDLMHVLDGPRGRAGHGTTWRTPLYASWDDAAGTAWGLGSTADMQGEGDAPPGAFLFDYCLPDGTVIPRGTTGSTYPSVVAGIATAVPIVNGIPTLSQQMAGTAGPAGAAGVPFQIFIKMRLVDVMMCSPFGFSYEQSFRETGMYGITNLLVNATLSQPSQARLIQASTTSNMQLLGYDWNTGVKNGSPLEKASLWLTFISPSIQSTLPPRSVVSLCNIQYFQQTAPVAAAVVEDGGPLALGTVTFPAVTFANVPDMFLISVRPDPTTLQKTCGWTEADWCCTYPDNAFAQFTFANQSGLFSGWPSHVLTMVSRNNGCKDSVLQYGGFGGEGYFMSGGRKTVAGGGILCIRPAQDFALPTGTAPGSTGQVQLTFQLNFNAPGVNVGRQFVCTVVALSSGYFVTEDGVSRQLLVGLDDATVLGAPEGPDRYLTSKLVGGGFFSTLSSFAKNALENKDKLGAIAASGYDAYKNGNPMGALSAARDGYHALRGNPRGSAMAGSALNRRPPTLAARLSAAS